MCKSYNNLGIQNGWNSDPREFTNHIEKCGERKTITITDSESYDYTFYPTVTRKKLGNCYYEYACSKCEIKWSVDSSD
jgi:hypothetical protein